ncbi:hypothetical protein GCM10027066_19060 [Dyella jejuensis]
MIQERAHVQYFIQLRDALGGQVEQQLARLGDIGMHQAMRQLGQRAVGGLQRQVVIIRTDQR